jgi:hypothetical protein
MPSSDHRILVNRAPVLTLWAAIVAHRLGFDWNEALTLGRAVAGLSAQAKGRSLGILQPAPKSLKKQRSELGEGERIFVELLGRAVPAIQTPDGLRALEKEMPGKPDSVERYLEKAFGDRLPDVRVAMAELSKSISESDLNTWAFKLYEGFRPEVPPGERGWGAKGVLDLKRITTAGAKLSK